LGDTAVWLGTDNGLVHFHLGTKILKKFNTIPLPIAANKDEIRVGHVKSIALLENGMVAVGTSGQGLLLFNAKTQQFDYQYYPKPYQANSGAMPFTQINDLYLDPAHNLWASSWGSGVTYTNLKTQSWEYITLAKLPKTFEVVKILERSNGEIWAMSNEQGIAVLNQKGAVLRYYTHQDLPTDRYRHVQEDSLGRVWLVGRSHAVVYVPDAKKFYLLDQKEISFKNFTVLPNKIVVGLTENGQLYSPQIQSNGQIEYTLVSNFSNFSKYLATQNHRLKAIFSHKTNVYALTMDTIYKLTYTPSVKQWEMVQSWKYQIQDAIYINTDNSFLVNNNESIFYFDKQTEQQYYISSSKINLTNIESAIDIGNRQILVMGGDKINLYDFNNGSTTPIAMLMQYLSFGSTLLKNKEMWVGTHTGIVKLKPTDFNSQSEQTTIQLTRLQINDEFEYQEGNISEVDNFTLPSNHQTLTFGMTAIAYNHVFRPVLRYKLENIDNDFLSSNSSAMEVRYAKLAYGNYRLVIEALDSRSNKILAKKEVHIKIETPIWLRTWALILYALVIIGLAWWSIRLWISRAQKQIKMQKQLSDNQITSLRAQINPHFIVNSVGSISSLIRKHLNVQALEAVEHFSIILNRTLHASDENKITLKDEIKILEKYIAMERLTREIDIDFEVTYNTSIDPEDIEMPTFILQLFVENSVKHGIINKVYKDGERPAINIAFDIKYIKNIEILQAIITDNGIGFDPTQKSAANKKEVRKRVSLGMKLVRERLKLILQLRQHQSILDSVKDKLLRRKRKEEFDPISVTCLYDDEQRPIGTQVIVLIPLEGGY
jgi:ligand-binding sensor domain-containing protein